MTLKYARRLAVLGLLAGIGVAVAQTPAPQPTLVDAAAKDYGTRPVAFIYDNVAVTRADLAEFLIARGGYEKVELLVNKKIIEAEAAKRGITCSKAEMDKALEDDLKGLEVSKQQFIEVVLSKYGKTYYEWMEDVVRPRLLLTTMCKQDVVVTDDDLRKEYDRLYGEKRRVQIIIWPKGDEFKSISRTWDEIRKDGKAFDRVAGQQANPGLASTMGHVSPIGRNLTAEEKIIENTAFDMQIGDVSPVFMTSQGYTVLKLVDIIPPDAFDSFFRPKRTFETEKAKLQSAVFELKLSREIPKYFEKLKAGAKPQILMAGPPAEWKYEKPKNAVQPVAATAQSK